MLIDLEKAIAKHHLRIKGVIHVGMHLAEEADIYDDLGISDVLWIEANPEVLPKAAKALKEYPNQRIYQGLVTNEMGTKHVFNVTNFDGRSSSVYPFGTHAEQHPEVVIEKRFMLRSVTLDHICMLQKPWANMLVMDVQGAELLVLQGATEVLKHIDYVYTEVNDDQLYEGCALTPEIVEYLSPKFGMVESSMTVHGWGDALFVREGR